VRAIWWHREGSSPALSGGKLITVLNPFPRNLQLPPTPTPSQSPLPCQGSRQAANHLPCSHFPQKDWVRSGEGGESELKNFPRGTKVGRVALLKIPGAGRLCCSSS
jgi:hypothetical protein